MQQRLERIDLFRTIAIVSVITIHVSQVCKTIYINHNIEVNNFAFRIFSFGNYGVPLFFVISGYLLSLLYGSNLVSSSVKSFDIYTFAKRRLSRIYPLWALFLTLYVSIFLISRAGPLKFPFQHKVFTWVDVLGTSSTEISNEQLLMAIILALFFLIWIWPSFEDCLIPGGWSIQSEVFFYLMYPMIRRLHLYQLTLLFLFFDFLYNFTKHHSSGFMFQYFRLFYTYGFLSSLTYFVLGMVMYEISTFNVKLNFLSLINILAAGYLFISLGSRIATRGDNMEALCFLLILFAGYFVCFQDKKPPKFMLEIGSISYGIYFIHFPLLFIFEYYASKCHDSYFVVLDNTISYPLLVSLLILFILFLSKKLAAILFIFIEKPLMARFRD